MGEPGHNRKKQRLERLTGVCAALLCLMAVALSVAGRSVPELARLVGGAASVAAIGVALYLAVRLGRLFDDAAEKKAAAKSAAASAGAATAWTTDRIVGTLGRIDWYQFEKFCAAVLRAEGNEVERKPGEKPDDGAELIVKKDGRTMLVWCRHWRTWAVQEKVVRELVAAMKRLVVSHGAIYTLRGPTRVAAEFAEQWGIDVVAERPLASRALAVLDPAELTRLLDLQTHHCPRCESVMVRQTGGVEPFWICSNYPECRGLIQDSGAK